MKFKGTNLFVCKGLYSNGQNCLKLYDTVARELFAVASVAIGISLKENEVAIKNYSENEGVLDELIKAGVIDPPHQYYSSGFVLIPICRFSRAFQEAYSMEPNADPFPDRKEYKMETTAIEN